MSGRACRRMSVVLFSLPFSFSVPSTARARTYSLSQARSRLFVLPFLATAQRKE